MTATEKLRQLLDERGVVYKKPVDDTTIYYDSNGNRYTYSVNPDSGWSQLFGYNLTPEQAIAATLGEVRAGSSRFELTAEQVHDAIFNGSSYASYDGAKYYADGIGMQAIADELNAALGAEREAELQKALNKATGNWAKADAELRKALDFMRIWISDDAHLGESELSAVFEKAEGLRKLDAIESAIAAMLSTDECEQVLVDCDDGLLPPFTAHCSECGAEWGYTPKYCPNCGRKVK